MLTEHVDGSMLGIVPFIVEVVFSIQTVAFISKIYFTQQYLVTPGS